MPFCSQSPHDETVVAMGQGCVLARPGRAGEKTRAVKGNLGHSSKEGCRELEGARPMRAVKDSLAGPLRAKWENRKGLDRGPHVDHNMGALPKRGKVRERGRAT